jgi:hypothetical protein
LFDLIEGTETPLSPDDDGYLLLELKSRSVALYFIVPVDDKHALATLRQQHAIIRDLLDPATALLPDHDPESALSGG